MEQATSTKKSVQNNKLASNGPKWQLQKWPAIELPFGQLDHALQEK